MANDNLKKAKAAKNDEFYTQLYDIETEMNAYLEYNPDLFRGKTVLLPCDDPEWSNFTRYFASRFQELGLKKLISTSYAQKSKEQTIDQYMAAHCYSEEIGEMVNYFNSVIHWAAGLFKKIYDDMQQVDWQRLYETYHEQGYDAKALTERAAALQGDEAVKTKKNIYEYLLGGEKDTQLLGIRLFEEATKKAAYHRQTEEAKAKGRSNCPLCAVGNDALKTKIYTPKEMEADHVTAWSKRGKTTPENCQMLCKTHNRAKGNA